MKPPPDSSAIDWARRVNRTWFVNGQLNEHADAWLEHLVALNDGRLQHSCEAARAMCGIRERLDDPKPWFYAGLFSLATADEARRFLDNHRITKAAIPAMESDENVVLWMNRVGPETRELIERLRGALVQVASGHGR